MANYDIGETFVARDRLLDNPVLADKMVRRSISRLEINAVLSRNEIIETYEHGDRVRSCSAMRADGRCTWWLDKTT